MSYLPLITSFISLLTALSVAFFGYKFSRNIEKEKAKTAYINYAIQTIMDEYKNYDPTISLESQNNSDYNIFLESQNNSDHIRLVEKKFLECRRAIMRVSPVLLQNDLEKLNILNENYMEVIRRQHDERLSGKEPSAVNAHEYTTGLINYINNGYEILYNNILILRKGLE